MHVGQPGRCVFAPCVNLVLTSYQPEGRGLEYSTRAGSTIWFLCVFRFPDTGFLVTARSISDGLTPVTWRAPTTLTAAPTVIAPTTLPPRRNIHSSTTCAWPEIRPLAQLRIRDCEIRRESLFEAPTVPLLDTYPQLVQPDEAVAQPTRCSAFAGVTPSPDISNLGFFVRLLTSCLV